MAREVVYTIVVSKILSRLFGIFDTRPSLASRGHSLWAPASLFEVDTKGNAQ